MLKLFSKQYCALTKSVYLYSAQLRKILALFLFGVSATASAAPKVSELKNSLMPEIGAGGQIALSIFCLCGIVLVGCAMYSWVQCKRTGEPAKWQLAGIFGGACLTIIPFIILMVATSTSDNQGGTEAMFEQLDIQ